MFQYSVSFIVGRRPHLRAAEHKANHNNAIDPESKESSHFNTNTNMFGHHRGLCYTGGVKGQSLTSHCRQAPSESVQSSVCLTSLPVQTHERLIVGRFLWSGCRLSSVAGRLNGDEFPFSTTEEREDKEVKSEPTLV